MADKEPYILYIEDERPLLELVRHAMKIEGLKVVGVQTGEAGLTLMREERPQLLLLDLMLPDISGWEIYKQIKDDAALQNIPVITVTASVPDQGMVLVEDYPPVDDYITKPFDVALLLRAVKEILSEDS